MTKPNDGASIREVYQITQSIESKVDLLRDEVRQQYVTKEDFNVIKRDVQMLVAWRYWFMGATAVASTVAVTAYEYLKGYFTSRP